MNLVFICLCGCLLSSLLDRQRQAAAAAGESSVAKQPSRFAFLRFDFFRNGSFGQEVRVESRDCQPISVIISCPRDRNATQSTVTVQPNETMDLVLPGCYKASSQAEKGYGIELVSNGSIHVSVILTKRGIGNETRTSEYARLDLFPTSMLGASYLVFPPLAFNNSSHRSIELFLVALHDNTSVTVVQTGAEETPAIELDSFETFTMKRTSDATGIRILSSDLIAVYIFDSPDAKFGHFPTAGAEFPTTEAQTSRAREQTSTSGAQFSTTETPFSTSEAQFPSPGADYLSGYFTVMQVPPDDHWSDTYRLEMIHCQRDQILVGIAAASVNVTRVRLKEEKTEDRVLTIAGNQLTHVFLTFNNKTATVNIESEDRIQLLIYDEDTQREREDDKDRSTTKTEGFEEKVFVSVFTAAASSESFLLLPAAAAAKQKQQQLLISECCNGSTVNDDGRSRGLCSNGGGAGSDRGRLSCRLLQLAILSQQQQPTELNLKYEGNGSMTTTETGNKWVVKNRYNYTSSSRPTTSTENFYRTVAERRTLRISNPSPSADNTATAGDIARYSQPSLGVNSNQTVPVARPNLTDVLFHHRERGRTEDTFPVSEYGPTEQAFGNRVNEKEADEFNGTERQETDDNYSQYNEKHRSMYHTSAVKTTRNPDHSSTAIIDEHQNDNATAPFTLVHENSAEETGEKMAESPTTVPSSVLKNLNGVEVASGVPTTPIHRLNQTPPLKRFIYRPYNAKDIQLGAASFEGRPSEDDSKSPSSSVTSVPDTTTYRPTDEDKKRQKEKVVLVHKTLSLFVVKQDKDGRDRSGHKVVNYFEIDEAAKVDPYSTSTQDRGISSSPTVIAVITSLCGAVFFVIACILGFVITEVLCAKGKKLQRAKVSPCIDISNAGY